MSVAIERLVSSAESCTLSKSITNLKKKAKNTKIKPSMSLMCSLWITRLDRI